MAIKGQYVHVSIQYGTSSYYYFVCGLALIRSIHNIAGELESDATPTYSDGLCVLLSSVLQSTAIPHDAKRYCIVLYFLQDRTVRLDFLQDRIVRIVTLGG